MEPDKGPTEDDGIHVMNCYFGFLASTVLTSDCPFYILRVLTHYMYKGGKTVNLFKMELTYIHRVPKVFHYPISEKGLSLILHIQIRLINRYFKYYS